MARSMKVIGWRIVCQAGLWQIIFLPDSNSQFTIQLVKKFIPAFERAHGPGYQALVMVDNSQGHSTYAEDALLTSRMNMWPEANRLPGAMAGLFTMGKKCLRK